MSDMPLVLHKVLIRGAGKGTLVNPECRISGKAFGERRKRINASGLSGNVDLYRVDGCIIEDEKVKKVDLLIARGKGNGKGVMDLVFTELKGHNLKRALEQIEATVQHNNIIRIFEELGARHIAVSRYGFILLSSGAPKSQTGRDTVGEYERKLRFRIIRKQAKSYTMTDGDLRAAG